MGKLRYGWRADLKRFPKTFFARLVLFVFLAMSFSCGDVPSRSYVTITPENGATDQTLAVTVIARFSKAVSDLGSWNNYFFLVKQQTTDNLCTGYNFSSDGKTLQCLHDDLEPDTDYAVAVQHPQAEGESSSFTTGSN